MRATSGKEQFKKSLHSLNFFPEYSENNFRMDTRMAILKSLAINLRKIK